MPRKPKPRKPIASPEHVWVAPRPAHMQPQRFEPVGLVKSNRYLDFADIALGAKKPPSHQKKGGGLPLHDHHDQKRLLEQESGGKVTPINSHKTSNPRGPNQGFGAFRNSR